MKRIYGIVKKNKAGSKGKSGEEDLRDCFK